MDKIPQELVDRISSYLGIRDLKNTLLLSVAFQIAAEKFSGVFERFELNEENADRFVELYGGRRFRLLHHISFRTALPSLNSTVFHFCYESEDERQANDLCFTQQIRHLFSASKAVEERAAGVEQQTGRRTLTIYAPTQQIDPTYYCGHRGFLSSRIHLLQPDLLHCLSSISAFRFEYGMSFSEFPFPRTCSPRKIDLRIIADIAQKMPHLQCLECNIGGEEWVAPSRNKLLQQATQDCAGPRRDSRQTFAQILQTYSMPALRDANLDFIAPLKGALLFDHKEAIPNLIAPATHDSFSSSLRVLSYQLRRLNLKAIVDHNLFWPSSVSAQGATPFWPNLEILNVCFQIMTPSGQWYFNSVTNEGGSEGYIIDQSSYPLTVSNTTAEGRTCNDNINGLYDGKIADHQCRLVPNDDTLVSLLKSFAQAAVLMPGLKEATIWAPLALSQRPNDGIDKRSAEVEWKTLVSGLTSHSLNLNGECEPLAWGIAYTSPTGRQFMRHTEGDQVKNVRHIWWQVAKWHPDKNLHDMFTQIGQETHGPDLVEHWRSKRNGSGIAHRYEFEHFLNTGATFPRPQHRKDDGTITPWASSKRLMNRVDFMEEAEYLKSIPY